MIGQFLGSADYEPDWLVVARYVTMAIVCCQLKALKHPCTKSLVWATSFHNYSQSGYCIWIVVDLKQLTFKVVPSNEPYIFITLLTFPPIKCYLFIL